MSCPFNYELSGDGLRVRVGSWTVRRVAYTGMEYARLGWALWNEHWTNLWPFGKRVTIRLRRRGLPNFIVTPDDAEAFLSALAARGVPRR